MPRHVDHNDRVGNLPEGMTEFVETVEMRAYDFQDELERIRRIWAAEDAATVRRPRLSVGFHRPRLSSRF
jgi:hypothetical protein